MSSVRKKLFQQGPLPPLARSHFSDTFLNLPKGYLAQNELRRVVIIRDLRDVFPSLLKHVEQWHYKFDTRVHFKKGVWKKLSTIEKIQQLFDYTHIPSAYKWKYNNRTLPEQMRKVILRAIYYSTLPNTHVIRFEDLTGNNGINAQKECILALNEFLGLTLSEERMLFVTDKLFGNEFMPCSSFNKGLSGTWKSKFSPETLDLFYKLYGQELILLGYEQ